MSRNGQLLPRPWWDFRAALIVLRRVRSCMVVDFENYERPRFWQGWRATLRLWWQLGHGTQLRS